MKIIDETETLKKLKKILSSDCSHKKLKCFDW